jgi:hypothetical protein
MNHMSPSRVRSLLALYRPSRSVAATLALLVLVIAPFALAQGTTKPKKKGAKPDVSAEAASASASAPAPEPAPEAKPEPEPAASASAEASDSNAPAEAAAVDDTAESPSKSYKFVGLRYRGTIIPKFLEHLFVNEGGTLYSNTFGAEYDMRKDGKSLIAWLTYTEYGFGSDTLFWQKGTKDEDSNYSDVNSGLKAIYIGIDELWSAPLAPHLDFEYGFGVGLGFIFGSLTNDWVFQVADNTPGALVGSNGHSYLPCQTTNDGHGCDPMNHTTPNPAKVGGYTEPNWFGGGSIPVVFPHIAIPQFSLRYKPIPEMEARLSLGFSITGFWFGLSADYGLPQPKEGVPESVKKTGLSVHRDRL